MNKKNKKYYKLFLFLPAFWAGFFVPRANASLDIINEILLEGTAGEEFIELYNQTDDDIPLKDHYLAYYSSSRDWTNPYRNKKFPDSAIIKPKSYYLIAIKTGDFPEADWNLGYSAHQLSDSNGSLAIFPNSVFTETGALDSISWGKVDYVGKDKEFPPPKDGKSYEKKLPKWQESNLASGTPGKENSAWKEMVITDASSGITVKMDDAIYTNIYADFEVNYAGATGATKYTWNFGDKHKSYKQKTRHKFLSPGNYNASITIRGDQKAKKDFVISVTDYDAPKIRIIKLSPNPKGKDTGNEWIEIKNESKKKIDLKDWTIATGWEKLINHKITKKFIIKAKETKRLTRKFCAFTLNNSKLKLELRDPAGETVQKIKYNRKKDKIEEDEVFSLTGKKWDWDKSQIGSEEKNEIETEEENENPLLPSGEGGQRPDGGEIINPEKNNVSNDILFVPDSEIEAAIGKFTPNISWKNKNLSRIQLISYGTSINTPVVLANHPPMVAGASVSKILPTREKHWATALLDTSMRKINFGLNWIIRKL